ncbi:MAG TPA: hypothetical protein VGU66_08805 [Candidatus Elarobacter sp.]|nr:hypothetical protein [Candidatus Elarobacter sp.]
MSQYSLVLDVDDTGLRRLSKTRARIIVAKPSGTSKPNVAWLANEPSETTTIRWDEAYGLYAAHVPVRDCAQIAIVAAVHPAEDCVIYPFAGTAFGDPVTDGRIPRRHYDVRNDDRRPATFGLLQHATINDLAVGAPLNAVVLPPGLTADFAAVTTLYVWTQAGLEAGSIISHVPADAAVVTFDPVHRARRCRFDDRTGTFAKTGGEP